MEEKEEQAPRENRFQVRSPPAPPPTPPVGSRLRRPTPDYSTKSVEPPVDTGPATGTIGHQTGPTGLITGMRACVRFGFDAQEYSLYLPLYPLAYI